MRLEKKYKKYANFNRIKSSLPKRIFDFKHTKWKQLKKRNFRKINIKKTLKNPFIYHISSRFVDKVKNYYKKGLDLKTFLILFFNNSINVSFFKKELSRKSKKTVKNILINCFIKPLFRVDILLSQLNFFKTSFAARQYINEGKILINSKAVKGNYILKRGDIISFKNSNLNPLFYFLNSSLKFYSFIEFDRYIKTIIITKDIKMFSNQDINLILQKFFDNKILKDYF